MLFTNLIGLMWKAEMKFKLVLATLLIAPMMLTACAKKEEAKANAAQQEQAASAVVEQVTPEQQAAIDAIDQPNLDDNAEAASQAQ